MLSEQQRREYLGERYPYLFALLLKRIGDKDALSEYMENNKRDGKDSNYIHGYFLPWLQEQREQGLLQRIYRKPIHFGDHNVTDYYSGEVDKDDNLCG